MKMMKKMKSSMMAMKQSQKAMKMKAMNTWAMKAMKNKTWAPQPDLVCRKGVGLARRSKGGLVCYDAAQCHSCHVWVSAWYAWGPDTPRYCLVCFDRNQTDTTAAEKSHPNHFCVCGRLLKSEKS